MTDDKKDKLESVKTNTPSLLSQNPNPKLSLYAKLKKAYEEKKVADNQKKQEKLLERDALKETKRMSNLTSSLNHGDSKLLKKPAFSFKNLFSKKTQTKEERLKKEKEDEESLSLARILMKRRQKAKPKVSYYERIKHLKGFFEKAGMSIDEGTRHLKRLAITAIVINVLITFYFLIINIMARESIGYIITQLLFLWTIIFTLLIAVFGLLFFVVVDFIIYNRKKQIEEVLPDYLQLTSANVAAGMPIDQALWLAVRPRFGVLAKEIESVAKATLSGEDLRVALKDFGDKYDSVILKRSLSILIEGIDAGGSIGPLLDKIGTNIQETNIFKKEMAANVTTYVIFITFASVMAAPFLFALSTRLLVIITGIMANVNIPQEAMSGSISMNLSADVISFSDFRVFIILMLIITTLFSAMIVSTIKKGNIRDGLKYILYFIPSAIVIYFGADWVLSLFFSGIG